MSVGLCSNLVLFATPSRLTDKWRCSHTLLDLDTGCEWVVSFFHLPLYSALLPRKKPEGVSRFPLDRWQRQPLIRSGCSGEENNFLYCDESSPIPQARCHVQWMPSQHCMMRPRVAGLFLFRDRCLSFSRSSILATLLVLFSILFFDFNAAVGSNSWMYSVQWWDYSWNSNWKYKMSRNVCN